MKPSALCVLGGGAGQIHSGSVAAFDQARGLGSLCLVSAEGAELLVPFHCTAITDGSRTIDEGRAVVFTLRHGHLGSLEATRVEGRAPAAPSPAR